MSSHVLHSLNNLIKPECTATIVWSKYKNNLKIPAIRKADFSLHKPFQDFAFSIAKNTNERPKAFISRMEPLGYTLLEFQIFLDSIERNWTEVDNRLIKEYRDYSYEKVAASVSSRGEISAKQSTNIKVRIIYELYAWASSDTDERTPDIRADSDAAIQSTLPLHLANPNRWNSQAKKLFPLCFHGVGEGASNMGGQHWATIAELNDIEDYFVNNFDSFTAERNILFMRLIDQTGLRRGSANSSTIGQFSDTNLKKSIDSLASHTFQPAEQKFNGRNYFDIPYALSLAINRYIKSIYGADIFNKAVRNPALNELPLFLSSTNGKAIKDGSWTDIFTNAFRAVGAPLGAGVHSIRRKFAEEWFKKEIQRCIDQKLPISYNDIVAGLARVLGHDSKLSQEAYRRASRTSRVTTPLDALTEENRELNVRVMQLTAQLVQKDAEIYRLRKLIDDSVPPVKKSKKLLKSPNSALV